MKLKEKVDFLINKLEEIYPTLEIPLDHKDPYTLLIAVLMSAQSTDKKVNQITPILFKQADNPYDMIKLSIDEIRTIIKPVGLSPTKSKGIWNLSKILIDKYDGIVPQDISKLEELPSVGHKTASVVVSQAFGQPAFPVDTHIHRLMYRWGLSSGKNVQKTELDAKRLFPKSKWKVKNVQKTELDAKRLFPKSKWNGLHLRIIFYGREFCPARGWNIDNDIITKTIGRKSIINKLIK